MKMQDKREQNKIISLEQAIITHMSYLKIILFETFFEA
jgi:hypothetical protein